MIKGKKIAISGKGGVGKTTLAGLLIHYLIESGKGPVLAIDADPNANLGEVLGLTGGQSLGSIREKLSQQMDNLPAGMSKQEFLSYKIQSCLAEGEGVDLLNMGRPEGPGCYCFVNNLLRDIIKGISHQYPYLVIDNEAGLEHLSRRICQEMDLLLIVSDTSIRGLEAARRIRELADELGLPIQKRLLILNRVKNGMENLIEEKVKEVKLEVGGVIPEDEEVAPMEALGKPIIQLPSSSSLQRASRDLMKRLNL